VIDPGIGFGKTVADNIEIIQNLQKLKRFGFPLLLGVSRKSYLGKILKKEPKDLLLATLTTNSLAVQAGVDVIRVHDVAAHREMIDLLLYY
jgi:dihydropteroate synthase